MINTPTFGVSVARRGRKIKQAIRSKVDGRLCLCFLVGLFAYTGFNVVGQLGVSDIVMIVALPFVFKEATPYLGKSIMGTAFRLACFYLASLMASDIFRQTVPGDFLRGWAKVGIFTVALVVMPVMFGGKPQRMGAYLIGLWLASLSQVVLGNLPTYKFYVAMPLTGIAFVLAGRLLPRLGTMAYGIPLIIGAMSFLLNARSAAGLALLTISICLFNSNIPARVLASSRKMRTRSLRIGVAMVAAAWAIVSLYNWGSSSGQFGAESQKKFFLEHSKDEQSASVFDTLMGGRSESLYSIPKISESPLIGQGSWAKDKNYVRSRSAELHIKLIHGTVTDQGLIPSHSHLFGAWLEAGFLGAVFWGFALFLAFKVLLTGSYRFAAEWAPAFCLMFISLIWSILFSPFGGDVKVEEAALIVMLASSTQSRDIPRRNKARVTRN